MSKLLVVFGATGQQGGSIVEYVINDPELSMIYQVRAITRDPSTTKAQALKNKGIQVVKGDVDDKESIKQAMHGADTVFVMTVTIYDERLRERESAQGKALADAAVAAGAKYLIYSSLANATAISNGASIVPEFDGKFEVEEYIRTLPIKSAFFAPGSFMQNYLTLLRPKLIGDGTYAIVDVVSPKTKIPLIDITGDTGKYVGAILAEPDKYEGKVFYASTKLYTVEEIAQVFSKVTGKVVQYNQLPINVFKEFFPPVAADIFVDMFLYIQDFGYFGPQSKELVAETSSHARGKLTTLEEFLVREEFTLQ
ncbi:hypothetical protein EC991_008992 [Linnemannia zychae]|nr:hypothetical protein EC991_008992 [Linnemannia zychae]